nr:hypothetical protein TgIb.0470 [Toxoplasma gondii RH]
MERRDSMWSSRVRDVCTPLSSMATCEGAFAGPLRYLCTFRFCDQPGLTKPVGPCGEGYYCEAGSDRATPTGKECPAGKKCPGGSPAPSPCQPADVLVSRLLIPIKRKMRLLLMSCI